MTSTCFSGKKFTANFSRLLVAVVAVFCHLSAQAQSHVSGTITDSLGTPIFKAYVMETDNENRIHNSTTTDRSGNFTMAYTGAPNRYLRITADGYVTTHRKIETEEQLVRFSLAKRPVSRLSELRKQSTGKRKYVRSTKLLCGRSGIHEVPWTVLIEAINDTTFMLQMPVTAIDKRGVYPEGRTMVFLDKNDYHMLMGYNGEDANAILGNPADESIWNNFGKEGITEKVYAKNAESNFIDSNDPVYYYPQFLFTLEEMQMLCDKSDRLAYLIVDIETGDNYWNVYPMESFGKELTKILTKLTKKK